MADRIALFDILVPAGTTKASMTAFSMAFSPGTVEAIEIDVPPGSAGNLGFQIWSGGSQYIPLVGAGYYVLDDVHKVWPITGANNQGDFKLVAYNTDLWDHQLAITFRINENVPPGTALSSNYVSV
jgi:hypothetical protein